MCVCVCVAVGGYLIGSAELAAMSVNIVLGGGWWG